ncbi:DUF2931 family protein [Vibrio tritonius]|uniref:DUF2931 family protein n=1 Tax=Vibrio tritonius TaxID=1435069 RepID=UPI0008382051|nr:DUF2931 family protein [Vibrio tritonius]
MNKRINLIFLIVILIAVSLTFYFFNKNDQFSVPEGAAPWGVELYSSSLYPATIQAIHAINTQQDWTKVLMGLNDGIHRTNVDKIKKIFPDYNGFGIPLYHSFAAQYSQGDYGEVLPEKIIIYWTSEVNARFFITILYVNDVIISNINKMMYYPNNEKLNYNNKGCFPTTFDFGFFPDGTTKIWLSCGGQYRFVNAQVTTEEVEKNYNNYSKKDWEDSGRIKKIEERADYFGVKLFPINKKEMDKVYSDRKID